MRSLNVANNLMKILLYFSLQNIIISYIKLPIYTYHSNPPNKTTEFDYIKYFLENNIYTYLNLGSPPQKIVATLNFNDYPFFIYYNKCEIFSYFDIEKSNSYQKRPHQYLLTDVYVPSTARRSTTPPSSPARQRSSRCSSAASAPR